MGLFSSLIGGAIGIGKAALENQWAQEREKTARQENFNYNELAANNADQRTRNLYNDLHSPQAMYNQIRDAGLSPSYYYSGGLAGGGGVSGAQGGGASGISPTIYGVDPMLGANIAKMQAETENIKADTDLKKGETEATQLQNEYQEYVNTQKNTENYINTFTFKNEDGTSTSLFEIADSSNNYNDFLNKIREGAKKGGYDYFIEKSETEQGQSILRNIYTNSEKFDTYIKQLATDKTNAEFQKQILDVMKNSEFAKLNKESAIQYLKSNIEAGKLSERQRGAWNDLLDKLGKKGETTHDIVVVLGMLLNQMATTWNMPKIEQHTHNNYKTTNNYGE